MEKTVLSVGGMSCDHCVKAISKALEALPGISGVTVNLSGGTVTVEHDPARAPLERIAAEIEDQGYDVVT